VRTNQGDIDKCLDSDCDEASEDPYYEPNWCLNRKLTSPLGPTRPLVYFERLNAEQCTLDVCQRKGCGIGKEEGRDYCYKRKTMIPMIHTYQYRRSLTSWQISTSCGNTGYSLQQRWFRSDVWNSQEFYPLVMLSWIDSKSFHFSEMYSGFGYFHVREEVKRTSNAWNGINMFQVFSFHVIF
jgi:hypothetical protein